MTKDAEAVAELQRLGYVTTPVTVIDGAMIIGFDTAKIDAALSSWEGVCHGLRRGVILS